MKNNLAYVYMLPAFIGLFFTAFNLNFGVIVCFFICALQIYRLERSAEKLNIELINLLNRLKEK